MTKAALCVVSGQVLFDQNSCPVVGGKVYIYSAGTTAGRITYRDPALISAHPFPVLTDGFGRIPAIYIGLGDYKVVLKDAHDGLIWSADGLPGGVPDPVTPMPDTSTVISTGFMMPAYASGAVNGWVVANAQTLGSPASGASGYAADDGQALFVQLWNIDSSLVVSGGRGTSATADWSAGKTIALPDWRGKSPVGRDSMGNALAGVITSATCATPDQLGTQFGIEAETLSIDQIPSIAPAVTIAAAGGFTGSGTTDVQGSHFHSGVTDQQGLHQHSASFNNTASAGTGARDVQTFDAGLLQVQTDSQGLHGHNLSINAAGDHQHNVMLAAVPDHTHTATTTPVGGGKAHPNVQPGILVTWYIKL